MSVTVLLIIICMGSVIFSCMPYYVQEQEDVWELFFIVVYFVFVLFIDCIDEIEIQSCIRQNYCVYTKIFLFGIEHNVGCIYFMGGIVAELKHALVEVVCYANIMVDHFIFWRINCLKDKSGMIMLLALSFCLNCDCVLQYAYIYIYIYT